MFREARFAYRERKAEIVAARKGNGALDDRDRPKQQQAYTIDDDRSGTPSRRSRRIHHPSHDENYQRRPQVSRRHTSGAPHLSPRYTAQDAMLDYEARLAQSSSIRSPRSHHPPKSPPSPHQKIQRHGRTLERQLETRSLPVSPSRPHSASFVDMDLAYGEAPPNLLISTRDEETELNGLVGRVKGLLDEADCVQHSVTATIANLQRNPDAMAAVALSLAEISNLVKKMAPGALMSIRRVAPTVFALLSSPQFLIAAGVGVGITVVALGGYKIIKKIQAKKEEESMDQMLELGSDVSRIETWMQGIADEESRSIGTSVEGEFITPIAASLSSIDLRDDEWESPKSKHPRSSPREAKSVKSSSSRHPKSSKNRDGRPKKDGKDKKKERDTKLSPLRLMFRA